MQRTVWDSLLLDFWFCTQINAKAPIFHGICLVTNTVLKHSHPPLHQFTSIQILQITKLKNMNTNCDLYTLGLKVYIFHLPNTYYYYSYHKENTITYNLLFDTVKIYCQLCFQQQAESLFFRYI